MGRSPAGWLARRDRLPTSARAVFGYYAKSGVFDYRSLRLKRRVDGEVEAMLADVFGDIEEALAAEFGLEYVDFSYETKLLLPAKLALGYLYRRLPADEHARAESLTRLAIIALLDGDMRDARNDAEFEDFEVDFVVDEADRRRVAKVAQELMETYVQAGLVDVPDSARETYEWAVTRSERHQERDERYRELMDAARAGEEGALETIRSEYKFAPLDEPRAPFTDDEGDLPYLASQYYRVGIIYDGMLDMYRDVGFPIDESFQRAIVLAIVGAQIWLDDIEDYHLDMRAGQLTPVTAEYLLAADEQAARAAVVDLSHRYLDLARTAATAADSPLTGIAVEYIRHEGRPDRLPGDTRPT